MSWNEGGSNNRGGSGGPPDLEQAIKRFVDKLSSGKNGGGVGDKAAKGISIGFIFGIVFLLWLLSGIFIVSPAERAVILQFGKYQETVGPGPHWIPRLVQSYRKVNVQRISTFSYKAHMLTKDENIVDVDLSVQYRVDNSRDYLFNVVNPFDSIQQATASALRQVVGHTTLDEILTTGRELVRQQVADQIKKTLSLYKAGVLITDVNLQPAKPPEEVTEAFDDAIKAREDEQRYINQANAYSQRVLAIVKGKVARLQQRAIAMKEQLILQAKANVAGYLAILTPYHEAPKVTKERLYLDAVQSMLENSSKVLLDVKGSNNIMYLPIDRMIAKNKLQAKAVTDLEDVIDKSDVASAEKSITDKLEVKHVPLSSYLPRRSYSQIGD